MEGKVVRLLQDSVNIPASAKGLKCNMEKSWSNQFSHLLTLNNQQQHLLLRSCMLKDNGIVVVIMLNCHYDIQIVYYDNSIFFSMLNYPVVYLNLERY